MQPWWAIAWRAKHFALPVPARLSCVLLMIVYRQLWFLSHACVHIPTTHANLSVTDIHTLLSLLNVDAVLAIAPPMRQHNIAHSDSDEDLW